MKEKTAVMVTGMVLVTGFSSLAVAQGYDGMVIGTTLFILGSAMGIIMPRPTFLKG